VAGVFGIESGYVGTIKSNMAKLIMGQVVADINEKHMAPWSIMCSAVREAFLLYGFTATNDFARLIVWLRNQLSSLQPHLCA